jgi:hypothetical protein
MRHSIHDVFNSGIAMMFFQDPSIPQFQKRLEGGIHMRASTHMLIFPDWEILLRRLLKPSEFL